MTDISLNRYTSAWKRKIRTAEVKRPKIKSMITWVNTKERTPNYDGFYCCIFKGGDRTVCNYAPYRKKWFELGKEVKPEYWLDDMDWDDEMEKSDWDEAANQRYNEESLKPDLLGMAYWIAQNSIFHEEGRWWNPDRLLCETDDELIGLYMEHVKKWENGDHIH